jgi:hypothetical protein
MKMPVKHQITFVILLLVLPLATFSHSEENNEPSLELLEFLGDFTTDDGDWIDPKELGEIDLAEYEDTSNENTNLGTWKILNYRL